MATTTSENGPGWFATLGGALLLVVLGFGVGLVAGAAYEEPELVMEHLAGRSTDVPLQTATQASPAPRPDFDEGVAEAPAPAPEARPLGSPATQPAASPPAVAAPPPRSGFAVQVGAFGLEGSARELAVALEGDGFPTFVERVGAGDAPFKVRVGPLPNRAQADRLAERLKGEYRLPTWVLDRGKGS